MKRLVVLVMATVGLAAVPAAATEYPPADNLLTVSDATPCPGDTFGVEAGTFAPGSTVTVTLLPNSVLGTPVADDEGQVALDVTLPAAQTPGKQTIQASGTTDDGKPLTLTSTIDVVSCDEVPPTTAPPTSAPGAAGGGDDLPRTGSDSTMRLLRVGGGLAALGGVLVALAATRRRRSAATA